MSLDLRKHDCNDVLGRMQHALDTHFEVATEVRKRRSIGFRTTRNTWVRIEAKGIDRLDGQAWGVEAASRVSGVAMPAWRQGVSWPDSDRGVVWRADETDLVTDASIKPGGTLTTELELSAAWWQTFNGSLDALAEHTTARTATPTLEPITPARVATIIRAVFPGVNTEITEWRAAHADLGWANLTAPNCWLLDWEDFGMAPRGWDAATLWAESLAVPSLADRVLRERHADLDGRAGRLALLFQCAELMAAPAGYAGVRLEPARAAAAKLVTDL